MRILQIQAHVYKEKEKNLDALEAKINEYKDQKIDLVTIGEMFDCPYQTDCFPKYAEKEKEATWARLSSIAAKFGVYLSAGSVPEKDDKGHIYNTAYVFDRAGSCIAEYDKIHGFSPSGEDVIYQGGNHRQTFTLDGHKCGIIICYDVRFPELTRNLALDGIEILFVPAQWPNIRTFHWVTLTTTRAIENQMFVVSCNSVGRAGNTVCGGNSRIFDPWGETIASAGISENIMTGEIDFSVIEKIRHDINVFRDRNKELDRVL